MKIALEKIRSPYWGWPGVSGAGAVLLGFLLNLGCLPAEPHGIAPETALEFDGRNDAIRVAHDDGLNPGKENWTCEFRLKLLSDFQIGHSKFIAKRDGSGDAGGFYIGSRFAPACSDGNRQNLGYQDHIPLGEWVHVAVQIDRDENKLRAYINGELMAESDSELTGSVDASSELVIGGDSSGGLQGNHCRLSHVRIWKGVNLTQDEIRANMGKSLTGEEEGLAGYWRMQEGQGETVKDLAQGNDSEFDGEPGWVLFRTDLTAHKEFRPGESVTFGPVELHNPRGEVTYRWYFNNEPIEGATESSLSLSEMTLDDLGTYHVLVDDAREYTPAESSRVRLAEPDWPMWRFDAARSAETPVRLSEELHLHWVRELPEPKRAWPFQWDDRGKLDFDVSYAPVVMGGRIFVPSNVTDSVTAYGIADGAELWRFHADGPVRLAPAAYRDRVYFTSDDGHLYCVDAETGDLDWKFQAGPSDHRLLGNERIINFWAARGGPVVKEGTVYFAAGIFPLHGVFIYALDAATGEVEWVNDTTSSDYVQLPHGRARGYGGLVPQGYIAADAEKLVVSAGRGQSPAILDRRTGEVLRTQFRGRKGEGHYAVHAEGMGEKRNDRVADRVEALGDQIEGEVFYKLAARDRLFVTTEEGALYCFGPEELPAVKYEYSPEPVRPRTTRWAQTAVEVLQHLGESEGYALLLGAGSGDLLRELLGRSELHIVVVENDPAKVTALRKELAEAGMYGRRAAVIETAPDAFSVQPYLFSLVLSEDATAAGLAADASAMENVLDRLRPYGGLAWLGAPEKASAFAAAAGAAEVDPVTVTDGGNHLFARRGGPLSGAGQWTHQYHDAANTLLSRDQRVRLPLGVLWFGGPNHDNILPRHSGGPRPQVAGGRQVYLGVETIGARCVYTGRQLWEKEFPGIGHPFTNLELEERWATGREVYMTNIPGATYIGSPFVTLPDSVFVRYEGRIHRLSPATGEVTDTFTPPGRSVAELHGDEDAPEWGHISVEGDYLITTSEPHIFEDQELGWTDSYSGTSSRRLVVMDRSSGEVLWERGARVGFRHKAIISNEETLYVIDGLSKNALEHLARRGKQPEESSRILALNLRDGEELWRVDSDVFGTYLLYSAEHDILLEGGSQDLRRRLGDEPRNIAARRGSDGGILWESGEFTLPAAVRGEMLIPGRPGTALCLLTGEEWERTQPLTGTSSGWSYQRAYGCNTLNASEHLLFYRSGYAGYFDLEHDTGTGNFAGFRSGCTANMLAADGVLNALDYTRTCTCSYGIQTSLALVHMPGDSNLESWTRYDASPPDPANHGLNFGAPGRRVDESDRVWYDSAGTHRRHPSAIRSNAGGLDWVAASLREGDTEITMEDLIDTTYRVRAHFAELDKDVAAGQRIFDLYLDGEKVLEGFDIVAATGAPLHGTVEEFTAEVRGGGLTFELRASNGSERDPVISGIELVAEGLDEVAGARSGTLEKLRRPGDRRPEAGGHRFSGEK